jgi:hypothetical protein
LDSEKAVLLAELERSLNERQEAILLKARQDIDLLQNAANQQKMAVFKEAQAKANQQVDQITEQVAGLAAEDAQRRLQSTTQTVLLFYLFFNIYFYIFLFRLLQQNLLHQVRVIYQLMLLQLLQQQ